MVHLSTLSFAVLAASAAVDVATAHMVEKREPHPTASLYARQARQTTGAFSAFSGTLPASLSSVIATITSGVASSVPTATAKSTYSAGAANPSISNAPPLPIAANGIRVADFPPLDRIPNASFGISQQILASVDLTGVPNIPLTDGTCAGSPSNARNAQANHWWTCGQWTTPSDITVCPDKNTWGLSYDDGPSPYTPDLIDYLEQNNLKTTFFIVGSRAISRPDILQYEYMNGHQLSVHTWSHPSLTNLTNEQIVLELGWTKEVIRRITGVTPNTMRPPYGDIDDRVRFIAARMNLTPIIWTSTGPNSNYDTGDWKIGAGTVSAAQSLANFERILSGASNLSTGYIVLAHDLYPQSVELATGAVLPQALAMTPKQTLEPIISCLNLPLGDAYIETNRNVSGSGGAGSLTSSSSAAGASQTAGNSGTLGSGAGSSSGSGSTTSSRPSSALSNASTSLAMVLVAMCSLLAFYAL